MSKRTFFITVFFMVSFLSVFSGISNTKLEKGRSDFVFSAKNYQHLLGMKGFSDELLLMHFKLYEGYVKNTNALLQEMSSLIETNKDRSYDFGALKRRLGWEFDGMRLHELYFDSLGGNGDSSYINNELLKRINESFGSFEAWKKEFIAVGMMRGIGWAILYQDKVSGRLLNVWVNEHGTGHLVDADPIVVMDVFEHAYITQYGLDRDKYIEAFFNHLNWETLSSRLVNSIKAK